MAPRVVDLFCGCGGFALGARQGGLAPSLSIDVDPILTSSIAANFPETRLVLADIGSLSGADIENEAGGSIDGLFGGPPCQGFSSIGKRRHDDPRRDLLRDFFRIVREVQPAFFVMENVQGLGYSDSLPILMDAISALGNSYNVVGPVALDAAEFGAATRRVRLFVVGTSRERCDDFHAKDLEPYRMAPATVADAISDLSDAKYLGIDGTGFDVWKRTEQVQKSHYLERVTDASGLFTGHRKTVHTRAVEDRFRSVAPGKVDKVGRHPKLAWSGQCPTLRAGTGRDRGSFQAVRPLHPELPRVITVREAARLQGFPDSFRFHPTVWHSFRMIGNSVAPMVAAAIFRVLASKFEHD